MKLLQQTGSHLVETRDLASEPYSRVIGYPACSGEELERRVDELKENNVSALLFEGSSKIGKLGILGKGCVSVVVKAVVDGNVRALKIRRIDADRETMERESELLKNANNTGVGPSFIRSSKNFLLMELIDGINIFRFMENVKEIEKVKHVASEVLDQCYRLDIISLDHGELSYLGKHVIVGDKVTIIDFESASVNRRASNVTAAMQYLFIGGAVARKVRELLQIDSIEDVISSLRNYKGDPNRENLERLKDVLHL